MFLSWGEGVITPQAESNTTPPSPKTEINIFYILNFASTIKFKINFSLTFYHNKKQKPPLQIYRPRPKFAPGVRTYGHEANWRFSRLLARQKWTIRHDAKAPFMFYLFIHPFAISIALGQVSQVLSTQKQCFITNNFTRLT
jgi:hypothetical protein